MTGRTESTPQTGPIEQQVLRIVAARTLYDEAQLSPDSDLEGELGIDSIILESVLGTVKEHFGIEAELPSTPATLRELIDAVAEAVGDGPLPQGAPAAPAAEAGDAEDGLLETVLASAMRHTQYERHQLDVDADFESELGIDSVILTSITGDVADAYGLPDGATGSVTATTLRKLVAELDALRTAQAPAAAEGSWDDRSMKDFLEERSTDLFAKARSFAAYRRKREEDRLYWYGMPTRSRSENRAVIFDELEGREREFLHFASNNYLGLANHPKVVEAVCDATRRCGATHTGSRIIGGTNMLHKELERRLAAFKKAPACAVFPGGYSANLGVISGLVKSYDALVIDKLNHMSIVDGCKLSGGIRKIYRHNDMADLERVLQRCSEPGSGVLGKLIVVDGVFSMHGDVCDLPEIVRLAKEYDARVLVDDAHATGVLGATGSGTAEHFGLKGQVDLELGTMSKALAGMGGFVVGDEEVVDYLRFYANSYVFAANIPAGVAAGLIASLDVMEAEPERLERLWSNIRDLRGRLKEAGFDLEHTESAILPIVVGDERRAMEMGRAVRARGLFCQTVVFPGVPLGDARLRISVTSEHTPEDLEEAAGIFIEAGRETGVLPPSA
ncbi:aminotransferase class I/II-fold pyridoxal phosphate-dependent enzyme [Streptomyces sp. JJ36]|uniref:aminotransferase class I/II-fold pyridoxal phosphate-dependent enzyme n=1 Tax=Streptomyces sp. JJ36 TaxID=2736645 RepID=UPI001F002320|nr:aminotransferase class I/II-fold pyridoxal phosphate-dependent enzyme [Streptomyces sp. JJ36]MCF6521793.1 aminotransferase class I/II-fold pyridoxal phosphate-dependent enzyme [Streptomyces sp. JJ36]